MAIDHRAKPGRAWQFKDGCIFTLDGKRSRLVATLHGTPEQREEAARRILAVMEREEADVDLLDTSGRRVEFGG